MNNSNSVAMTRDWLKVSEGMTITSYDPQFTLNPELEIVEPGQPVNLPAADRDRMNYARPGAHTRPERL